VYLALETRVKFNTRTSETAVKHHMTANPIRMRSYDVMIIRLLYRLHAVYVQNENL